MNSKPVTIKIKRIYEQPLESDGHRVYVDRLWARGLSKEETMVDVWLKEIAPSTELRRWYGHDEKKWPEFKSRYAEELEANSTQVDALLQELKVDVVTFLYSSKEEKRNNAVALKQYIASIYRDKVV